MVRIHGKKRAASFCIQPFIFSLVEVSRVGISWLIPTIPVTFLPGFLKNNLLCSPSSQLSLRSVGFICLKSHCASDQPPVLPMVFFFFCWAKLKRVLIKANVFWLPRGIMDPESGWKQCKLQAECEACKTQLSQHPVTVQHKGQNLTPSRESEIFSI